MKLALVSIRPPHTTNIFSEKKGVEWRTKPMPTGKHYVYETKSGGGVGKVVGQFLIWRIQRFTQIDKIPKEIIRYGCVPADFLQHYSKGKPIYAHWIDEPIRYEKPFELSEFTRLRKTKFGYEPVKIARPPQSWCYVEGGE